jgi:hypothetical protein
MSAERAISKEDIAVLLASALGQDKSDEVVTSTARSLGITRTAFTADDIRAIFEKLVKAEGLVGVVARFAVSRRDVDRLVAQASQVSQAPSAMARPELRASGHAGPVGSASSGTSGNSLSPSARAATVDIVPLIAPALGIEKARDAIEAAAARRGVDIATGLSHAGALAVLDEMTKVDGIVGVVARFAKARFLLNPDE